MGALASCIEAEAELVAVTQEEVSISEITDDGTTLDELFLGTVSGSVKRTTASCTAAERRGVRTAALFNIDSQDKL